MNRRELAKNGILGLCGFVAAMFLPEKVEPIWASSPEFPLGAEYTTSQGVRYIYMRADDDIPPGWEFLNDPAEDIYS